MLVPVILPSSILTDHFLSPTALYPDSTAQVYELAT